jgi:hypothetical protein
MFKDNLLKLIKSTVLLFKSTFKLYRYYNWQEHSIHIKKTFGDVQNNFIVIDLPKKLIKNLNLFFESCDDLFPRDNEQKNQLKIRNKVNQEKWIKTFKYHKFKKIEGDIFSNKNKNLMDLCTYINNKLVSKLNKPYIFVGLKMWKTTTNAINFGMNEFHKDGFLPFHSKIMIYLQPLNENYGSLQINQTILKFKNPKAIWFKNSDVLHKGISGKKYDRRVIEITIMHTIDKLPDYNIYKNILPHNYDERHLKSPSIAYQ